MSRSPAPVSQAAAAQRRPAALRALRPTAETRNLATDRPKAPGGDGRRAAVWFAMALVGQVVSLSLIDAGTRLRYQHYRVPPAILPGDWWLWTLVAVQAV